MFSTVWESTSDEIARYDIAKVEPISPQANVAAAKITFKDGRLLYFFDAEENVTFSCDGIEFGGKAGALLVADKCYATITGSGKITYKGKTLEQPAKDFTAKVEDVDLFKETITLDKEVPSQLIGRMFRVGDYAQVRGCHQEGGQSPLWSHPGQIWHGHLFSSRRISLPYGA